MALMKMLVLEGREVNVERKTSDSFTMMCNGRVVLASTVDSVSMGTSVTMP